MKFLRYSFLLIMISCSSSRVFYDYDTKANFDDYKTFNFFEDVGEGLNKFDVERITNEIKVNLEKQGLKHTEENPDFYINVLSKVKRMNEQDSSVGVSIGGGNGGFGYGISTGIPIGVRKIHQEITIDFVESKNKGLLWQSISNTQFKENITPKARDEYYQKLIKKVILGFPPKAK